jgi:hypothetical protein
VRKNKSLPAKKPHSHRPAAPEIVEGFRQRQRQKLALILDCTKMVSDAKRRAKLKEVLIDLFLLHEGAVILKGLVIFVPGGVLPVPQTCPFILALTMASPRDDWRATLANEILLYLEKAYRSGHAQAVNDAVEWCRTYRLPVPDWVRDAPRHLNRRGKRSTEKQNKLFETDFVRSIEAKINSLRIAAERKKKGNRRDSRSRDKFMRAKESLGDHWTNTSSADTGAINDSHTRFLKHRDSYYLDPAFLMELLKVHALAVFEIVSSI